MALFGLVKNKYERAAEAQIAKKAKSAYYQAKEAEEIKFAGQRAQIERERKVAAMKAKPAGGFMSGFNQVANALAGGTPRVGRVGAPKVGRRKVIRYVKKGKRYVKRTSYAPTKAARQPTQQRSFGMEFGGGGPTVKDILG